jgi:protein AATF/BFR2
MKTEVFDDVDFYQQLLRDVIDSRSNGAGGDEWMLIQRQKKASKKKVDTRASKGRKIRYSFDLFFCFPPTTYLPSEHRYEVHEKLQNFMVPVPVQGSWHEEQIDELFASLLGKGIGSVDVEVAEEANREAERLAEEQMAEGFHVFG